MRHSSDTERIANIDGVEAAAQSGYVCIEQRRRAVMYRYNFVNGIAEQKTAIQR